MADGAAQRKAHQGGSDISPVDRIVQANRAYYDAWRTMWAQDSSHIKAPKEIEGAKKDNNADEHSAADI